MSAVHVTVGTRHRRQRGQGLVEFAFVLPVFLLLLLSMVDFGFAFYTNLTIEYATREGARVGAALAAGDSKTPCAKVDDYVIAAVQRVLQSAGIRVDLNPSDPQGGGVRWVRIYKADATGAGYGTDGSLGANANQWTYSAGGGPVVDGHALDFTKGAESWSACTPRKNAIAAPDSLGVAINYTYAYMTPLAGIYQVLFGGPPPTIRIMDKTVMQLNPTGG